MCETVLQFFKSIHIARDIRDGKEFWNPLTKEYVFRDPDWDTEQEWEDRGVWDVCCLDKLKPTEDEPGMFGEWDYDLDGEEDIAIPEVALRIATEKGWLPVRLGV